jgi:transcriptional regulator with XRE-family HTH domain
MDWNLYAHRLRVIRIVLGLSEKDAAVAHGVTLRTYRKWEAGAEQRSPTPMLNFASRHNVSIDWLVIGEGAAIDSHLAKRAQGKVAILPVKGPRWRQHQVAAAPPRTPAPAA